jgi:glyoxylase-like metal-dependent hydrolase (beta-lactamase superfamily II)
MVKRYILHPATFKLDGGAMFGIIPKPLWAKKIEPDEFNRILMSLRVVLFVTEHKKILIDTGIGGYHKDKFNQQFDISHTGSPLEDCLSELNITASEITDVVLTHLHFDHIGGLGKGESGDQMIFKNATVHIQKEHYQYALNPTLRDSGSFQQHYFKPLLDQYESLERIHWLTGSEGEILADGDWKLNFKASFGHTPHMIHPYDEKIIYMADLVPMDHHVHIPWVMGYDIEPGITTVYKQKFYEFINKNDLTMIFEHDNETWGTKLSLDDKGRYISHHKFKSNQGKFLEIN